MASIDKDGYKSIRNTEHHFATRRGYVLEHRLVWEEHHKAILLPWGVAHHKNGNRVDNRIENLEGMMKSKHTHLHEFIDKSDRHCSFCNSKTLKNKTRGDYYEYWYKDGKGGFLCNKCGLKKIRGRLNPY